MKLCPQCHREYSDETLNFCLDDGTWLREISEVNEPRTAIISEPPVSAGGRSASESPTRIHSAEDLSGNFAGKRKLVLGILGILLITAIGIAAYWFYNDQTSKQIDSLAVMPFVNESGNSNVEYLSDGITESLINSLSTLPNLTVKARNTVFRYKGKEIDEKKVGTELSVQAVLFGRVIQYGDDLTISLSLVDSVTGNALWGEQYDRKMQDLPALRNDIARDVAQKLRSRLSNADATNLTKNYTANAEALRLYFYGRYFWTRRTPESIKKAIEYFNQAIEKDPGFARAYSGLADAYVVPASGMAPQDAMPKAKAAATRALEIDDTLAEAHTSLARVLQVYDWNWAEAEKEYKRALEIDPRYPVAHQWYGGFREKRGDFDEGISERKLALQLDPLSTATNFELGAVYYFARDYDRAIEQLEKTLELDPQFSPARNYLAGAYFQRGRHDDAVAKLGTPDPRGLSSVGIGGFVYAVTGRTKEARNMLSEFKSSRGPQYVSPVDIAMIHVGLGEREEAIAWLEKGYEERAYQMQNLGIEPMWDSLRSDPRFADLVRKVGLSN